MNRFPPSSYLRLRPRAALACAALLTLLTACGPGGPKVKTGDDNGGGSGRTTGITLVAGNFTENDANDGNGAKARFDTPRGIVIDGAGNLYVADTGNFAIRKIATDGTVTTFAGLMRASGTTNANGNRARFTQPTALAIDAAGNLFVTDNYTVRKVTTAGEVSNVYTIPSGAGNAFLPGGIAIDSANNLIVTTGVDTRRIASDYRSATVLESGQSAHYDFGNDVLLARGVAVNASNVAYVAALDNTVGSAASNARALSFYAGLSGAPGLAPSLDGNAANTRFGNLVAMTADKDGNLYAADAGYNTVRKITTKAAASTVAGTAGSTAATSTGKLPGTLSNLRGIATDGNGNLYVTSGNAVFKITLP